MWKKVLLTQNFQWEAGMGGGNLFTLFFHYPALILIKK